MVSWRGLASGAGTAALADSWTMGANEGGAEMQEEVAAVAADIERELRSSIKQKRIAMQEEAEKQGSSSRNRKSQGLAIQTKEKSTP